MAFITHDPALVECALDLYGFSLPVDVAILVVYFFGGWPFLVGLKDEIKSKSPGMMTLVGVAITVAYVYSVSIVFGLPGMDFFWELATLILIMLLGHWIEIDPL